MRCKNTKETNTTTNFKQVGAHKILGLSLKINEPKTPECRYCQIPRSESISRGQKEGGGLEARREKKPSQKNIGCCQWNITLTTCVASLSEATSDRLLIK